MANKKLTEAKNTKKELANSYTSKGATLIDEKKFNEAITIYEKALSRRNNMTYEVKDIAQIKDVADNKAGFIKAMWCGCRECEEKLKEQIGITSRCIPFEQEKISDKCVV